MTQFGVSQPVVRREDRRLLTGQGRFVDDLQPDGLLHGHVVRSPLAHAGFTIEDPPDEKDRATIRTTLSFEQMMALEHGSEEDTVATDDAEDDATSVPESGVLRKKKPRK